jgi:uncharacterized LabA/DUF88 family protein
MKRAIVLIDGENFQFKVDQIIKEEKIKKDVDTADIKLGKLIDDIFSSDKKLEIIEKRYYSAKLHLYKETLEHSKMLIAWQRKLKTGLEKQGFNFTISGHVRAQFPNKKKPIFKEKGVDVKIAVDMVSLACDKKADVIILCSSDSDLQPAVQEAIRRGVDVIYLGFSINPNKGLSFTTSKTVLFRNPEIINSLNIK